MASNFRAQRLIDEFNDSIDEFNDSVAWHGLGSFCVNHGIAAVLRHLAETEAVYSDDGSFYGVRASSLEDLAEALTAHASPVPTTTETNDD